MHLRETDVHLYLHLVSSACTAAATVPPPAWVPEELRELWVAARRQSEECRSLLVGEDGRESAERRVLWKDSLLGLAEAAKQIGFVVSDSVIQFCYARGLSSSAFPITGLSLVSNFQVF